MIYKLSDIELQYGQQFQDASGTTYPSDWLEFATEENLNAVGIIVLTEIGDPSPNFTDDDVALTQTYQPLTINQNEPKSTRTF